MPRFFLSPVSLGHLRDSQCLFCNLNPSRRFRVLSSNPSSLAVCPWTTSLLSLCPAMHYPWGLLISLCSAMQCFAVVAGSGAVYSWPVSSSISRSPRHRNEGVYITPLQGFIWVCWTGLCASWASHVRQRSKIGLGEQLEGKAKSE